MAEAITPPLSIPRFTSTFKPTEERLRQDLKRNERTMVVPIDLINSENELPVDTVKSTKKRKGTELGEMIKRKNKENTKRMRIGETNNGEADDKTGEREFNKALVETFNKIQDERKQEEEEDKNNLTRFQIDEKLYFKTPDAEARPKELAPYPDLTQAVLMKMIPTKDNPNKLSAWQLMSDEVKKIRSDWKMRIANSKRRGVVKQGTRILKTKIVAVERERDELSLRLQRSENHNAHLKEDLRKVEEDNIKLRMEVDRLTKQWQDRQDTIMSFDSYIPRPGEHEHWGDDEMFLTECGGSKSLMVV